MSLRRPPLVVVQEGEEVFEAAVREMEARGWPIRRRWDDPRPFVNRTPPVCVGTVRSDEDASQALLAAVRGAGLVVRVELAAPAFERFVEDLRHVGPVEYWRGETGAEPTVALNEEQRALLALLGQGHSLGEAAASLHVSRRTAARRMQGARRVLNVSTTAEAVVVARKLLEPGPPAAKRPAEPSGREE